MRASTNRLFAKDVKFATMDRSRYETARIVKPACYPGRVKQQHQYRKHDGVGLNHCREQN